MKAILCARSRSKRGAPRPVLYALLVLVSIGASATAQSGSPAVLSAVAQAKVEASAKVSGALVARLDSIAGAGVREDRSVGVVAAVVKGKDTLLVNFYGAYGN